MNYRYVNDDQAFSQSNVSETTNQYQESMRSNVIVATEKQQQDSMSKSLNSSKTRRTHPPTMQELEVSNIRQLMGIKDQNTSFLGEFYEKNQKQTVYNITKRKLCPDFIFTIVYAALWIIMIYIFAFSKDYNLKQNATQFHLFLEPTDYLRRVCGDQGDQQPDVHSVDYSKVIQSFEQTQNFCQMLNQMAQDDKTYSIESIKQFNYDCNSLVYNIDEQPNAETNWNTTASIQFYEQVKKLYNDMTDYSVGFQAQENICIKPQNEEDICQIPTDAQYLCNREWNDFIKYALSDINYGLLSEQVKNGSFLSQLDYTFIVNRLDSKYTFIGKLCQQIPDGYEREYIQEFVPKLIQTDNRRCIINYQSAITNAEQMDQTIEGYLAYFTNCFKQPVATIIKEFDQGWVGLLLDIVLAVVVTLIFQIVMQCCHKCIVYFIFGLLVAALIVFCVFIFTYAANISIINQDYYQKFGQMDSESQLQEIIFYIIAILLLIITVAVFSLSCLIQDLQKGVKQILIVIRYTLKKELLICIHIILSLALQLGMIFVIMQTILKFSSLGRYDVSSGMFTFNVQNVGEPQQNDIKMTLIQVYNVIMLINTFFIIQGSLQFIIGLSTMQVYAQNKNRISQQNTFLWAKRLLYFIRSLGSICLYSIFCTFFIWFRPIIEILASFNSKSTFVEVCKILISMMKDEVVYTMALTGQNYIKSAKIYKEVAYIDIERMGSIRKINNLINNISSLSITCVTQAIKMILAEFLSFTQIGSQNNIWLMIISFIISYICGYYSDSMNNYILKSQMFIYRYEEYQTNSYIIMGDEEINKLRRLIDIK